MFQRNELGCIRHGRRGSLSGRVISLSDFILWRKLMHLDLQFREKDDLVNFLLRNKCLLKILIINQYVIFFSKIKLRKIQLFKIISYFQGSLNFRISIHFILQFVFIFISTFFFLNPRRTLFFGCAWIRQPRHNSAQPYSA